MNIDERPEVVDRKSRLVDWEGDTIIGKGRRSADKDAFLPGFIFCTQCDSEQTGKGPKPNFEPDEAMD